MIGEFGYRVPVFENGKKPKGGPLEIEKFFVEGVNEMGWRGSGAY